MGRPGGDNGDDKPFRLLENQRRIRRTSTETTQKTGNTLAARIASSNTVDAALLPRNPMQETNTDRPLMAPHRASAKKESWNKEHTYGKPGQEIPHGGNTNPSYCSRFRADEALMEQDIGLPVEEVLLSVTPPLERGVSESSNLVLRERVMAATVFKDDNSYAEDQQKKASLREELLERLSPIRPEDSSSESPDEPELFEDEYCGEISSSSLVPELPLCRQLKTVMTSQPGAYQGSPGEGFRRNASNWKQPFVSRSCYPTDAGTITHNAPDGGDFMPPSSLRAWTDDSLVDALPVVDEESELDPLQLELARPQSEGTLALKRRRRRLLCYVETLLVLFCILILALIVGLVVRSRRKDKPPTVIYNTNAPSAPPTSPPTFAPTLPWIEGLPVSTLRSIEGNRTSPQARAYHWLGADPNLSNYSSSAKRQRFALAVVYFSTMGRNWNESNNWLDYRTNECLWDAKDGKKALTNCNGGGAFLQLQLGNISLGGTLPPEIGLLTALEVLDVSDNYLQGTLVSEVGLLSNLTTLLVNNNHMAGSLPTQVGLLSRISRFNIADNSFQGSLPTEIGHMTKLVDWQMKKTKIGGAIPTEIGNWRQLKSMWAWNTAFTGTLPSEMGLMTSLTYLAMHNGVLQGTIPTEFGLLSALTYLQLDVNKFSGTIPRTMALLKELRLLSFGSNLLVSTIPTELGLLPWLQGLRFYQNQLTGSIPTEFGKLRFLQRLEVDDNQLVGTIPSELAELPFLAKLFLSNNRLSGSLPPHLGNLAHLKELTLINNQGIGGSIPTEWENLANHNLQELFLIGVNITGTIPHGLCKIERLVLDCKGNVCGCMCQAC